MKIAVHYSSCEVFSSEPITCPLCHTLVPANTPHSCRQAPPLTARAKFSRGQRVQLVTWDPHDGRHHGASRTGVVTGFGRDREEHVRVRRDSSNTPETWHMSHWQVIEG